MIPIRSGIFFARTSRMLEGLTPRRGSVEAGKGIGKAPGAAAKQKETPTKVGVSR